MSPPHHPQLMLIIARCVSTGTRQLWAKKACIDTHMNAHSKWSSIHFHTRVVACYHLEKSSTHSWGSLKTQLPGSTRAQMWTQSAKILLLFFSTGQDSPTDLCCHHPTKKSSPTGWRYGSMATHRDTTQVVALCRTWPWLQVSQPPSLCFSAASCILTQ